VAVPLNLPPQALSRLSRQQQLSHLRVSHLRPRAASPARAANPNANRSGCFARRLWATAASNHAHEALTCYQDQAEQGGLAGETGNYGLARCGAIRSANLASALQAFQRMRSRFPGGVLRTEADLSIIEILPRLGRHSDALAESERFLIAHPEAGRSGEIHLLRGNIFREALHDLIAPSTSMPKVPNRRAHGRRQPFPARRVPGGTGTHRGSPKGLPSLRTPQ